MNNQFEQIKDVGVTITVELGRTKMPIKELLALHNGSIVALNTKEGEPLKFYANGRLLGLCEIVTLAPKHEKYGIRVLKLFTKEELINQNNL